MALLPYLREKIRKYIDNNNNYKVHSISVRSNILSIDEIDHPTSSIVFTRLSGTFRNLCIPTDFSDNKLAWDWLESHLYSFCEESEKELLEDLIDFCIDLISFVTYYEMDDLHITNKCLFLEELPDGNWEESFIGKVNYTGLDFDISICIKVSRDCFGNKHRYWKPNGESKVFRKYVKSDILSFIEEREGSWTF